jgi:hypothetical protein
MTGDSLGSRSGCITAACFPIGQDRQTLIVLGCGVIRFASLESGESVGKGLVRRESKGETYHRSREGHSCSPVARANGNDAD